GPDGAGVEGGAVAVGLVGDLFVSAGQVAVAVLVHVQDVAIADQPDAALALLAEHQQAVSRLAGVARLLADGPGHLQRCPDGRGRQQKGRRTCEEPRSHGPGSPRGDVETCRPCTDRFYSQPALSDTLAVSYHLALPGGRR